MRQTDYYVCVWTSWCVHPNCDPVQLNRPQNANALNEHMWQEIKECFQKLSKTDDCRAVVLTGAGKHFWLFSRVFLSAWKRRLCGGMNASVWCEGQ